MMVYFCCISSRFPSFRNVVSGRFTSMTSMSGMISLPFLRLGNSSFCPLSSDTLSVMSVCSPMKNCSESTLTSTATCERAEHIINKERINEDILSLCII